MTDTGGGGRHRMAGFALVILSALCYSSLPIFGKLAFAERLPLVSFLSTRFTLATLLLWGLVLSSPRSRGAIGKLSRRRLIELFLWGVFGYAVQSALFFTALQTISASLTEVLLYTCPAFLAVILWVRTGRPPAVSRLAAIGVAIGGSPESGVITFKVSETSAASASSAGGLTYAASMVSSSASDAANSSRLSSAASTW